MIFNKHKADELKEEELVDKSLNELYMVRVITRTLHSAAKFGQKRSLKRDLKLLGKIIDSKR